MTAHFGLANGLPDQQGLSEYMRYTQERAAQILHRREDVPALGMKTSWLSKR